MARRGKATKNKRNQPKRWVKPIDPAKSRSARRITWGLGAVTVAAFIGSIVATTLSDRGKDLTFDAPSPNIPAEVVPALNRTTVNTDFEIEPKTADELLSLSLADLDKVDIARMNLLCAAHMPSTEDLDIEYALATLDRWAEKIAFETDRHLYRVADPRFAERYNGSESHYRAEMLAQVLYEDLGIKYNKTAIGSFSFADPSVAFIHGMIPGPDQSTAETPGGTCASMPVLYVALGRRLGYPLMLSTTNSHIFARWDGEALYGKPGGHDNPAWRETFNCETTNGFEKYDDAYYKTWPIPVTNQEIARNKFLESLDASETFAQFIAARGHHGKDVGEYRFAARCFENAHGYDLSRPCYAAWFTEVALKCNYKPVMPRLQNELAMKRAEIENDKRQAKIMKQAHQGPQIKVPVPYDHQQQLNAIHKQYGHRIWSEPQQPHYATTDPFQPNTGP